MSTLTIMKEVKLAACFGAALFVPELKATAKQQALEEMVDHLCQHGRVRDKGLVLEMISRRENLGSTGIGKGIAIPHGRSLGAPELSLLFARSTAGIEFDSLDKQPVHLFFMIVAPPQERANIYLPVLGKIVEKVKESRARSRLMKLEDLEELKKVFFPDAQ
jgi:mannitol/fructose-specific phosphotransferase system IIA component (Ntr-type)